MAEYLSDEEVKKFGLTAPTADSEYLSEEEVAKFGLQSPVQGAGELAPPMDSTGLPFSEEEDLSKISKLESLGRAAVQVPTMGFADEAIGGLQALGDIATTDKQMSDYEKLYTTYRDVQRRKDKMAEKANPWTSRLGTGVGIGASMLVPGLNAANTVKTAAAMGAASGLGSSEADLTKGEFKDAAKDVALGGVLGGATQAVLPAVGKAVGGLRQSLQKGGEGAIEGGAERIFAGGLNPSLREVGEFRKSINLIDKSYIDDVATKAASEFPDISPQALVEKLVNIKGGPKVIEKATKDRIAQIELTKKDLFTQAANVVKSSDQIDQLANISLPKQLDEIAEAAVLNQTDLTPQQKVDLAGELKSSFQEYLSPMTKLPDVVDGKVVPGSEGRNVLNLNNLFHIDQIKKTIGQDISPVGFDKWSKIMEMEKTPLGSARLAAKRKAYDAVRDHITAAGDIIGDNLGSAIKKANLEEHNLITIRDLAENATNKEILRGGGGMGTGMAMTAGAGALGGVVGGLGGAIAGIGGKFAAEAALGQGLEKAGKIAFGKAQQIAGQKMIGASEKLQPFEPVMQGVGGFLDKYVTPGAVSAIPQAGVKRSPFTEQKNTSNLATYDNDQLGGVASMLQGASDGKLKNYGEALGKALKSGDPQAKNAAIFLIMQNPKARKELGLMNKGEGLP